MKFIGITGGVGAGKSTVLDYIATHKNARILKADEISAKLCEPKNEADTKMRKQSEPNIDGNEKLQESHERGETVNERLQKLFANEDCFDEAGVMNRNKVAAIIFSDEQKRRQMERIVHPAVKKEILRIYEEEKKKEELDFLILEAALLIEEHYDEICDELWYIWTNEENRRKRLKESRGYSDEKINRIFAGQLTEEEYRKHCKACIDNNHSAAETIANVERVFAERSKAWV